MSIFHTYCAICGGSLGHYELGATAPSALRRRRRIVARNVAERRGGERTDSNDERTASESDNDGRHHGLDSEEYDWDTEQEDNSYDPELVNDESLQWLLESCCLGVNPGAPESCTGFVSGRMTQLVAGVMECVVGNDPNEPSAGSHRPFYCYFEPDAVGIVVYPFHCHCLGILTEALTGSKDLTRIDKNVLYEVMAGLKLASSQRLNLDYGNISGHGQTWKCVPGEEFSVSDPSPDPKITGMISAFLNIWLADRFDMRPDSLSIARRHEVKDPFSRLPLEMLLNVFRFLPANDLLSLLKASWPAFCMTHGNSFWYSLLKRDLGFLAEVFPLLEEQARLGRNVSYKSVYLWLNEVTTPRYGLEWPFTCLANRRRIWDVCEQLAYHYHRQRKVRPVESADPSISEAAICRHMAIISAERQPRLDSWEFRKALVLYSWEEVCKWPLIFVAHWDDLGRLLGLSVETTCGQHKRARGIYGPETLPRPDGTSYKTAVRVEEHVAAIELYIATADPNDSAIAPPSVVSIKVHTTSRVRYSLDGGWVRTDELPCVSSTILPVSDGACLVGIAGHIDPHGEAIRSIGILEAPLPSRSTPVPSRTPPCAHRLWDPRSAVYMPEYVTCCEPADFRLESRDMHVFPLTTTPSRVSMVPDHLIPHETLYWARSSEQMSTLASVLLHVGKSGDAVHGFKIEYTERCMYQYAGMRANMRGYHKAEWDEDEVVHFEIDGPAGELIDEIAVSEESGDALAFKIKTNRGREVCVGDAGCQGWKSQRAPEGESIVGLFVAFTGTTKIETYGTLSSVSVVTAVIR